MIKIASGICVSGWDLCILDPLCYSIYICFSRNVMDACLQFFLFDLSGLLKKPLTKAYIDS